MMVNDLSRDDAAVTADRNSNRQVKITNRVKITVWVRITVSVSSLMEESGSQISGRMSFDD